MQGGIENRWIVNDVADRINLVKHPGAMSAGTNTRIYSRALMTNPARHQSARLVKLEPGH